MTLIWPFRTKLDAQWRRIDQGQDLQGAGPAEEDVLAIAAGTISYAHDPGGGGAHFGDPYPVLTFTAPVAGNPACYYGHTFPAVAAGTQVHQGDVIAHTGSPGGGGAPEHWLELGWWNGGPTGDGASMHAAMLAAPIHQSPSPPGGFAMPVFLSDADGDAWFVRKCFNDELGREPTAAEQAGWVAYKTAHGADLTLAGIRDSTEAQNFRKRRGW
jgi:hypothetical protein